MRERNAYFIHIFMKRSNKKEKLIIMPKAFSEKVRKDLTLFLKNLVINAKANR